MLRDNQWLQNRMHELWENHFCDIPRRNQVIIKFGRRSKRQLGSIKWATQKTRGIKKLLDKEYVDDDKRITIITITALFMSARVPQYVVDATIAHEMIHYAHGFHSPLKQKHKHAHRGSLIKKEMIKRELGITWAEAEEWLKKRWQR